MLWSWALVLGVGLGLWSWVFVLLFGPRDLIAKRPRRRKSKEPRTNQRLKPEDLRPKTYSYRSATSGSIFVARRAGIKQATNATTTRTTTTAVIVARSVGATPNKRVDITRVVA